MNDPDTIDELHTRLLDLIDEYSGQVSISVAVGTMEICKADLISRILTYDNTLQ